LPAATAQPGDPLHYYWKGKLLETPPLIYAAVFAVLLAYRALKRMSKNPAHGVSAAVR
jgi:DMSO/TMAO reductase YedYZ heme-binding membrane subunit